uniref:DNA polymerase n=1 Tax=Brachionus koreanus TaxID=1199090 RepID=A0A482DGA1_9BILA|nr:DNA polymerase delta catalytic subunit [Brachionus koreanus]
MDNKRKANPNIGTQKTKRFKSNGDDDNEIKTEFESELAAFDEDLIDSVEKIEIGQGPENVTTNAKWARPPLPKIDPSQDTLIFQQIDLDFYEGPPMKESLSSSQKVPIFRLYGVNEGGNSILAHLYGYVPYIYCSAPSGVKQTDLHRFTESLNNAVRNEVKQKDAPENIILGLKIESKENIYGFHGNKKALFLRIEIILSKYISVVKRMLETGFEFPGYGMQGYQTFESNIDFEIRFMADLNITGCNWIEVPAGVYKLRDKDEYMSRCQLEIDMNIKDLISHPAEGEWIKIAPLRMLSFDIECAGRKGVFPEAEKDPVIQIANMVQRQGEKDPFIRNIFTLNTCAPIVGSQVLSYMKENEMLMAWSNFVREVDPDIITGYNVQNFDIAYLLNRAKTLKVDLFPFLGRLKNIKTTEKKVVLQSKQMGRRENKSINMEGRVIFDLLLVLVRDYKLRSYTLNAVSFHFLQEQKEDVHHSIISDLQHGNEQTRRRLAVYCLKDAFLPLRLIDKLMCIINYMEMARVTGVPLGYLLNRGQQIKVVSQLLRKAKEQDLLIPAMKVDVNDEFEGATVIEPNKGYYDVPISTLDFNSLYPSIMIAHNLCYTTLLRGRPNDLKPEEYTATPSGNFFVKSELRRGVLPEILDNLLKARKRAKEMMKQEKDPFRYKVLDGRQLALKMSANSVYGFTGAQVGKLPCLEISQSVTSFGRTMIEKTKQLVEEKYQIKNGYKFDAKVIYGDTDSVMIKFGVDNLEDAMKLGREAAEYISATFVKPIKLEFEKCYFPYLLISKKRYAGLYFTKPDKYDKMDCKGIETVRRDNSPLVANLISVCLQKLLIDRDPNGAIDYAKQTISDLLCNRIDISQLVITKELTKTDKEYAGKQAHVELANKMRKRDPGSAPQLGDRVPFVIVAGAKGQATYEKAEDPVYVLEHNLPIDTQYYLENQISKPLIRIFEPILHERAEFVLLKGEHTLTKTVTISKIGGLAAFTKRKETCLSCKSILSDKESMNAVCSHCKHKESELYQKQICTIAALEDKFNRLWTQCQRCQGNLHEDVICTNQDCPIFYMRKKVQKDLQENDKIISRFGQIYW